MATDGEVEPQAPQQKTTEKQDSQEDQVEKVNKAKVSNGGSDSSPPPSASSSPPPVMSSSACSPSMSTIAASKGTITCLLCGGTHVYPGPRFESHLLNEHGVVFGIDFFVKVCLFKQRHGRLPKLEQDDGGAVEGGSHSHGSMSSNHSNGVSVGRRKSSASIPSPQNSSLANNNSSSSSVNDATDLHCYFGCDEVFKKDFQLMLHLRLRHQEEDQHDLARAFEAAEEEIALTRRSGSVYECALCGKQFHDNGAFYGHIQTKHNMQWREYKNRFGRCEIESAPFECKICGRVIKYDRNTVHTHLKNVHGINWAVYLDRVRKVQRGEEPGELPQIEVTECRVCNVNVKYLRDHLRNAHKITEQEYESLFQDEPPPEEKARQEKQEGVSTLKKSLLKSQQHQGSVPTPTPENVPQPAARPAVPKPPKSDIQDKTNKKCSSCNITFDSRRSFIEHCTTVHNMKFKTKSGFTISAPSIMQQQQKQQQQQHDREVQLQQQQQQQQQQLNAAAKHAQLHQGLSSRNFGTLSTPPPLVLGGVKRRAPDQHHQLVSRPRQQFVEPSPPPPPPAKVAKMESNHFLNDVVNIGDGGDEDGQNLHMAPQYSPAGVSKWNQCRYECCFCKKTTMSRSSMTSHIHNTHGIPIKEYKESNYPDIEVETHWFQCRLCTARTKFVKDCIAPHLKMSHNMDIETYEQQVMMPEDWPTAGNRPKSNMRDKSGFDHQRDTPPEQYLGDHFGGENDDGGGYQEEVDDTAVVGKDDKWNKCRFRCCLCDWMCADSRQMRTHIASNHGITHEEYQREYGTTEVVTRRFHCRLCGSQMKHCRQNIYAHMKDVHKISLTDYEQQVEGLADDEQRGKEDEMSAPAPPPPPPKVSMSSGQSQFSAGVTPGLLDNGNQPSRWNRCRFQCAICLKLSSEKRHVREHIIKLHQLSMQVSTEPHYIKRYRLI